MLIVQGAPDRNIELRQQILALAQRYKRYGVGMIYLKLRQAGVLVNYKRVERLYQEAKLQVRRRKRKKVPVSGPSAKMRPQSGGVSMPEGENFKSGSIGSMAEL
mgnify:CR=1 FL=1